jgi:hypothetical protein
MKRALVLLLLVQAQALWAADPAPARSAAKPSATDAPAKTEPAKAAPRKLLDLRIGDVRKYMTPEEYEALINPQADERNTVIVKADAPLVPMKSQLDVPGGIIAPFWALANPTQAWRIFAPIPNFKDGPTENKVPQRSMGLGPLRPGE